jgi:hypothetical protein
MLITPIAKCMPSTTTAATSVERSENAWPRPRASVARATDGGATPSRSFRTHGTNMIATSTATCASNALRMPTSPIRLTMPKPPAMPPRYFDAYMYPFARPRSSSVNRSTASASTATSWSALKTVWIKTIHASSLISSVRLGIATIASTVTAIMPWAKMIHGRRRPKRGIVIVSMIGPQTHLNVNGSVVNASAVPTTAWSSPCSVRYAGSVMAMKPHGMPCAT